jgi:hypothetical protein
MREYAKIWIYLKNTGRTSQAGRTSCCVNSFTRNSGKGKATVVESKSVVAKKVKRGLAEADSGNWR